MARKKPKTFNGNHTGKFGMQAGSAGAHSRPNPNLNFRDYPKGDTRRYFCVLAAIHLNGNSATVGEIVEKTGCAQAEARRTIALLEDQFGVEWGKSGVTWYVRSFGVLHIGLVIKLLSL